MSAWGVSAQGGCLHGGEVCLKNILVMVFPHLIIITILQSKFQYEMINLRTCHLRVNFYIREVIIMITWYKHDPLTLTHMLHLYVYQYRQMFPV